jgi:hypothetical protein
MAGRSDGVPIVLFSQILKQAPTMV